MTNPIYPCLWFDGNAKAAADFYCSVFKNSKIVTENPLVVIFELNGNRFMGLNGGPHFTFSEAVSFVISCDDQQEIDLYWQKLTENGGKESQCGWVKDRFGLSWQIVPTNLGEIMGKNPNAMPALMKMGKINIQQLLDA